MRKCCNGGVCVNIAWKRLMFFDHHSTELTDHGFFVNCPVFGFGFLKFSLHILKSSNTEVSLASQRCRSSEMVFALIHDNNQMWLQDAFGEPGCVPNPGLSVTVDGTVCTLCWCDGDLENNSVFKIVYNKNRIRFLFLPS